MRAGLALVTAATDEPIGLDEAKRHLRVEVPDDDDYIELLVAAARDYIEATANVCFMEQEFDQVHDAFPYYTEPYELLRWPVTSITSIKYLDQGNNVQTMPANQYILNGVTRPPRVAPAFAQYWPMLALQSLANVTIRYKAGVLKTASVADDRKKIPPRMRQALYMLLGHWFENRADVEVGTITSKVPEGSEDIIAGLMVPKYA